MANLFNEEKMTPQHREMMESLLGDIYEQVQYNDIITFLILIIVFILKDD